MLIEDHQQKLAELEEAIRAKDAALEKLVKKYESLSKVSQEKLDKAKEVSDQKTSKLQEDFLKEYEIIVKEKEHEVNKHKDTKLKLEKVSADFSNLKQIRDELEGRIDELTKTVTSLTTKLQESDNQ